MKQNSLIPYLIVVGIGATAILLAGQGLIKVITYIIGGN